MVENDGLRPATITADTASPVFDVGGYLKFASLSSMLNLKGVIAKIVRTGTGGICRGILS